FGNLFQHLFALCWGSGLKSGHELLLALLLLLRRHVAETARPLATSLGSTGSAPIFLLASWPGSSRGLGRFVQFLYLCCRRRPLAPIHRASFVVAASLRKARALGSNPFILEHLVVQDDLVSFVQAGTDFRFFLVTGADLDFA